MLLPVIVRRAPADLLAPLVIGLVILLGTSLLARVVDARLRGRTRTMTGWAMMLLAAVTLLVVTATVLPEAPTHALPFAAGVAVTVSPARRSRLRLPYQSALVLGMALLLLRADLPPAEIGMTVLLLVFVLWVAGFLSESLLGTRQRRLESREAAERRAELLSAVRDLSGRSPAQAAEIAVATLRSLGFSVAGVSIVRGGALVPVALEGIPPAPELEVGHGLAGTAVAEDRTLVSDDYAHDRRRLERREGLGSAIAVPIRSGGAPVGVVLGGRVEAGPVPQAKVEVAEVLADHLGGVLETEERLGRQRELLDRMQALDVMRGQLVTEVSEEVRDPLTVVRGIAETLVAHADELPDPDRRRLLEGFVAQTGSLRTIIDALLDFSRQQAARPVPTLGLSPVGDAVEAAAGGVPVAGDLDAVVRTDPVLLTRALETLRMTGAVREMVVTAEPDHVRLALALTTATTAPRLGLLLRLAERVIVTVGGGWQQVDEGVVIRLPRGGDEPSGAGS